MRKTEKTYGATVTIQNHPVKGNPYCPSLTKKRQKVPKQRGEKTRKISNAVELLALVAVTSTRNIIGNRTNGRVKKKEERWAYQGRPIIPRKQ